MFGGPGRDRTHDLFHAEGKACERRVARAKPWAQPLAAEPRISASTQLGASNWWTWSGSNRRPLPCHGSALPAAPQAHISEGNAGTNKPARSASLFSPSSGGSSNGLKFRKLGTLLTNPSLETHISVSSHSGRGGGTHAYANSTNLARSHRFLVDRGGMLSCL